MCALKFCLICSNEKAHINNLHAHQNENPNCDMIHKSLRSTHGLRSSAALALDPKYFLIHIPFESVECNQHRKYPWILPQTFTFYVKDLLKKFKWFIFVYSEYLNEPNKIVTSFNEKQIWKVQNICIEGPINTKAWSPSHRFQRGKLSSQWSK